MTGTTKKPQRTLQHRVDTKALRVIVGQLDEDWLIRSMEDRDYGIDMQLEFFENDYPTGHFAFVQIKGTSKTFVTEDKESEKEEVAITVPVKTLLYAEMFAAPFFLFGTSTKDNVTRFVWLQKYIETRLVIDYPSWRNEGDVQIYLPKINNLVSNREKFMVIVREQLISKQVSKFLLYEHFLADTAESIKQHVTEGLKNLSSTYSKEILDLKEFIAITFSDKKPEDKPYLSKIAALPILYSSLTVEKKMPRKDVIRLNETLQILIRMKQEYFSRSERDKLHAQLKWGCPY